MLDQVEDAPTGGVAGAAQSGSEVVGVRKRTPPVGAAIRDRLINKPGVVQQAGHVHVLKCGIALGYFNEAQEESKHRQYVGVIRGEAQCE